MPPAIDLELIKTFLTVVEAKGFKLAAHQLHKTPAAISQQIKRLEELLGKRVLERSNQGISLTSSGEVLREKGQQLMSLNYELLSEMREEELSGPLSFGAPTDYAPTLLQKLLPIFQREFPLTSPSIVLEPSRSLRPRVASGTLDMAIVAQEPGTQERYELWSEEIAWFGHRQNSDDVARVSLLTTDCILRDRAQRDLKESATPHSMVLEATTVASLKDAVVAGFCQSFLPTSMADQIHMEKSTNFGPPLQLSFCLIFGPRFEYEIAEQVARKFKKAINNNAD